MIGFPWICPCVPRGRVLWGIACDKAINTNFGGTVQVQHDVAQYWAYFFLLVSVLSLFVTILFTRKVIGADQGAAARRAMAAAMKERATAFLKRRNRTVAALLGMGLLLPSFAYAQ